MGDPEIVRFQCFGVFEKALGGDFGWILPFPPFWALAIVGFLGPMLIFQDRRPGPFPDLEPDLSFGGPVSRDLAVRTAELAAQAARLLV